jgi:hypothetical protein
MVPDVPGRDPERGSSVIAPLEALGRLAYHAEIVQGTERVL